MIGTEAALSEWFGPNSPNSGASVAIHNLDMNQGMKSHEFGYKWLNWQYGDMQISAQASREPCEVAKYSLIGWIFLFGWIGFLVAIIVVLGTMDLGLSTPTEIFEPSTWLAWVQTHTAFEVFVVLARVVVLVLGCYLLVTSILLVSTQANPTGLAARLVDYVALPALRRGLRLMVVPAIVGTTAIGPGFVAAPVGASSGDPTVQTAPGAVPPMMTRVDKTGADNEPTATTSATTTVRPPIVMAVPTEQAKTPIALIVQGEREWKVQPGDHLWGIAEKVMTEVGVADTDHPRIARYWETLVAANRDRLVDQANPDLIFADQTLVIPVPMTPSR